MDQLGSAEIPECTEHRYELRRRLLNSSYFDAHKRMARRRAMIFVPVVASGFAAVILLVVIQTNPTNTPLQSIEEKTEIAGTYDPDFLTDGLTATFVDGRPMIPVTYGVNTVQFSTTSSVLSIQ